MNEEDLSKLIEVRKFLIEKFEKCKDYKSNKNAIMREIDHAKFLHEAVVKIDAILADHVTFK